MRLDKLIYDVREATQAFTDKLDFDDRYIIYLYGIKRSKYLRQDLNNPNKIIDSSIQQKLCLEMELVDVSSCGLDLSCEKILRSKKPLPSLIGLHSRSSIVNVTPSNKIKMPFNFISKDRVYHLDGAPYPNSIYSFLDVDGHLYVYSKNEAFKLIECLTITAVFEDPLELKDYKDCCNCKTVKPCFDELTSDYPLQSHLIDIIRAEIVAELLGGIINKAKQDAQQAQQERNRNEGQSNS